MQARKAQAIAKRKDKNRQQISQRKVGIEKIGVERKEKQEKSFLCSQEKAQEIPY